MNITLGEDLAWQQRKAASFAFTPFYSGYTVGWTGNENDIRFNIATQLLRGNIHEIREAITEGRTS